MVIAQGALAGFQTGEGQNSVGQFIKGILAQAKSRGLMQEQTQGNIELAQSTAEAKAQYEPSTKRVLKVGESGEGQFVTGPEGQIDFAKNTSVISPREGITEGEKAAKDAKGNLKADIINRMREEQGGENVVEDSFQNQSLRDATAGGITTTAVQQRKQAIQFLTQNGAPITEGNIAAVIQQMGQ